jgi:hypothetical protein
VRRRLHSILALLFLHSALRGQETVALEERLEGLRLARQHCVTCHLFPDPSALDLKTWHDEVLPRMKYRLGFTSPELEKSTNIQILREHRRIPLKPVMTEAQWMTLSRFYFAEAPAAPRPQVDHEPITVGGTPFDVRLPILRLTNQSVCAVAIRPGSREIWIGQDHPGILLRLGSDGALLESFPLSSPPARIRFKDAQAWVAGMGVLTPNDQSSGALFRVAAGASPSSILSGLRRPVDFLDADFDGDGASEFVVAEFGNNIGRLSLHHPGISKPSELSGLPGTVALEAADHDGDGRLDFAALVSQETESLLLFQNDGKGGFRRSSLLQKPPQHGHSHFESADFDGDGRREFLVCNGDNGEFNSPLKPYHGVRIYRRAEAGMEEKWFYPLNGAYSAHAADYDGDGDLDVAAISYFPDYAANPRESFVYFENLGGWRFRPSTIKECIAGRWMVMASGDLDGDGDEDLVLGSYIRGPTTVPEFLMRTWDSSRIPLLILRNRTR